MPTMMTPEHLQLLSNRRLEEATHADEDAQSSDGDRALARAARYEMRRRRCEVPVQDRYAHK